MAGQMHGYIWLAEGSKCGNAERAQRDLPDGFATTTVFTMDLGQSGAKGNEMLKEANGRGIVPSP